MVISTKKDKKEAYDIVRRITLDNSKSMTMKKAFKEFITYTTVKGLLSKTIKFYEENIGYSFKATPNNTLCVDIDFITLQDYILHMLKYMGSANDMIPLK